MIINTLKHTKQFIFEHFHVDLYLLNYHRTSTTYITYLIYKDNLNNQE